MSNTLRISAEGLEQVIASYAAMPAQIQRAERRAINKTTKYVQRHALRDMAASMGLAQRLLADRVRMRAAGSGGLDHGVVWFGLSPLAVTRRRFGALRQGADGARAGGGMTFAGKFVATMPSGHEAVFERFGAKRAMRAGRYAGKTRQPIRTVAVPMDTAAHRAMVGAWASRAGARLLDVMAQELNYEVNVRGRA